jgi:hypothetical protein
MIITKFKLFEAKSKETKKIEEVEISPDVKKEIKRFDTKWGIELDSTFTLTEIDVISEGLSYYNTKFIKNRIDNIVREDLGSVHGRWKDTPKKKQMTLNPKIFKFKRKWKEGKTEIPYAVFVIVHETAHCVDHIEKVSFSKKWQAISGWKKCDINEKVPEGYIRYVEKRSGREIAGHKRSNWIHKEDADFCRKYTSRNPREEFADSLAFVILDLEEKMDGPGCQKKLIIIKDLLKKID